MLCFWHYQELFERRNGVNVREKGDRWDDNQKEDMCGCEVISASSSFLFHSFILHSMHCSKNCSKFQKSRSSLPFHRLNHASSPPSSLKLTFFGGKEREGSCPKKISTARVKVVCFLNLYFFPSPISPVRNAIISVTFQLQTIHWRRYSFWKNWTEKRHKEKSEKVLKSRQIEKMPLCTSIEKMLGVIIPLFYHLLLHPVHVLNVFNHQASDDRKSPKKTNEFPLISDSRLVFTWKTSAVFRPILRVVELVRFLSLSVSHSPFLLSPNTNFFFVLSEKRRSFPVRKPWKQCWPKRRK